MLLYQLPFFFCLVGKYKYTVTCSIVQNVQVPIEKPVLKNELCEPGYRAWLPQTGGCLTPPGLERAAHDEVTGFWPEFRG